MKQGLNSIISVEIDYDLDAVSYIDFIFTQPNVRKILRYPGDYTTRREDTNVIQVFWDRHTTYQFSPKDFVTMDVYIQPNDTHLAPETTITRFRLAPTLFRESEILSGVAEGDTEEAEQLFDTLKRMVAVELTTELHNRIDVLFALDRITEAQYRELVGA